MDKLEAVFLGHLTRKRLIHSVREEFERTVREIEGGLTTDSTHPSTSSTIHWPKKEQLCFPVFVQGGKRIKTCPGRTAPIGGLQLQTSSKPEFQDSTASHPRALETCPYLLPEVGSSSTPSPLEILTLTSLSSASSPAPSSVEGPSVGGREGEAMELSAPSPSEALPLTTNSTTTQTEQPKSPSDLSLTDNSVQSPSLEKPASPHPAQTGFRESNSQYRVQLSSEDSVEECGDMLGSEPVVRASFPRDKSELLELRAQLVVELVWLRQAIASRQSYLGLRDRLNTEER